MRRENPKHRFYVPEHVQFGTELQLPEDASKQIRTVLRLTEGDEVYVFDGSGREARGTIVRTPKTGVILQVSENPFAGKIAGPPEVHLGLALLKGDRFDLVVQKATELGVTSITPLETARTVISLPADRALSRVERWRRIAIEALEQCGRSDFVQINAPIRFADGLTAFCSRQRLIAWEEEPAESLVSQISHEDSGIDLLVGPEGGFTEDEVASAARAGFSRVSLGSLVLRSETAAIASIAMIRASVDVHARHAAPEMSNG